MTGCKSDGENRWVAMIDIPEAESSTVRSSEAVSYNGVRRSCAAVSLPIIEVIVHGDAKRVERNCIVQVLECNVGKGRACRGSSFTSGMRA